MFRLEDPLLLGLLAMLPLLWWVRRREARHRGAIRYPAVEHVRAAGEGRLRWMHRAPELLSTLAIAAGIVALARPQAGIASQELTTEGIDIVLALDVSTSMLAEDLQPNRLEAAKSVASEFVAGRTSDRIALVAFAGQAFTQAPLTFDYDVVRTLLSELRTGMIQDGTAVGMGIATAVKRLQASPATSKVVILLTDGQNNRGEIGPVTAADMARALDIRVYTIGAGTRGTAPIPVDDPLRGRYYATATVDTDEPTLQEVASRTGGRYFRATDNRSLEAIYREIDQLERTEVEVTNYETTRELFGPVLAVGLFLLLGEATLSQTVFRRLP